MELNEIGKEILTQDNLGTSEPCFVVEKRELILTNRYCSYDTVIWHNSDREQTVDNVNESDVFAALDELDAGGYLDDDWEKLYCKDVWTFVSAHFTRKSAEEFIARKEDDYPNGLRIFCYSAVHNNEFIAVRNHLSCAE